MSSSPRPRQSTRAPQPPPIIDSTTRSLPPPPPPRWRPPRARSRSRSPPPPPPPPPPPRRGGQLPPPSLCAPAASTSVPARARRASRRGGAVRGAVRRARPLTRAPADGFGVVLLRFGDGGFGSRPRSALLLLALLLLLTLLLLRIFLLRVFVPFVGGFLLLLRRRVGFLSARFERRFLRGGIHDEGLLVRRLDRRQRRSFASPRAAADFVFSRRRRRVRRRQPSRRGEGSRGGHPGRTPLVPGRIPLVPSVPAFGNWFGCRFVASVFASLAFFSSSSFLARTAHPSTWRLKTKLTSSPRLFA